MPHRTWCQFQLRAQLKGGARRSPARFCRSPWQAARGAARSTFERHSLVSDPRYWLRVLACFAALAGAPLVHAAKAPPADTAALHLLTYSGDQSALVALDREIAAASRDAAKLAPIESRLLETLRRTDSTFAARQAICQRLGMILAQSAPNLNSEAAKLLGAMLADERDSDLARLALEAVPSEPVDALFVSALGKATGRTLAGLVDSLGRRRAGPAVMPLAALFNNAHRPVGVGAVRALGQIGTPAAVAALRKAPAALAPYVAEAKLAAAQRLPAAEAAAVYRELQSDSRAPAHSRAAAFRSSLTHEPNTASARIAEALGRSDAAFKAVALEAIADVPGDEIVRLLTSKLASWDAPTQAAVVAALGRRGDASAVSAISAAAAHNDAQVRAAALAALGALPGSRDTTVVLARAAAGAKSDEAKIARQSLAQLNGPDVSAAILAGAGQGETTLRIVFLEQLALRNMTEGLPLLRQCRTDPDTRVRMAAVGALGDLAPAAEIQNLLQWTIAATDEGEQTRALRSVVNVALRERDARSRGRTVCEAIEAANADVAVRLLPALPRIGGEQSAACVARLALRDDQKLAEAAVATLGKWTDQTALDSLASVAAKGATPAIRAAAVDAAITTFERARTAWTDKSSTVVAALFASTTQVEARKQLLGLLNHAKDRAALKVAQSAQREPSLAEAARYTAAVIEANRAGPPRLRASTNTSTVKNVIDGKTSTRWTATANGDEWIELDFRTARPMRKITLDQTGRATDFPERYEVFVTNDVNTPGAALVTGKGERNRTVIELPPGTTGRYLVIRNTLERSEGQWAVSELIVD